MGSRGASAVASESPARSPTPASCCLQRHASVTHGNRGERTAHSILPGRGDSLNGDACWSRAKGHLRIKILRVARSRHAGRIPPRLFLLHSHDRSSRASRRLGVCRAFRSRPSSSRARARARDSVSHAYRADRDPRIPASVLSHRRSAHKDGYRLRKADLKFSGEISPHLRWRIGFDAAKALTVVLTRRRFGRCRRDRRDPRPALAHAAGCGAHLGEEQRSRDVGQQIIPLTLEGTIPTSKVETIERDHLHHRAIARHRAWATCATSARRRTDSRDGIEYHVGVFNETGDDLGRRRESTKGRDGPSRVSPAVRSESPDRRVGRIRGRTARAASRARRRRAPVSRRSVHAARRNDVGARRLAAPVRVVRARRVAADNAASARGALRFVGSRSRRTRPGSPTGSNGSSHGARAISSMGASRSGPQRRAPNISERHLAARRDDRTGRVSERVLGRFALAPILIGARRARDGRARPATRVGRAAAQRG